MKGYVKRFWTADDIAMLRRDYADTPTADIAARLGRKVHQVYAKAGNLGLKKSEAFMNGDNSGRLSAKTAARGVGVSGRFKKGLRPWNAGTKGISGTHQNCKATQFKKGEMSGAAQHNYVPVGSLRVTRDGILEKKITDDPSLYPARRWRPVTRLVWEACIGPIPRGFIVTFKPGMHTTAEEEITADKLMLLSRRENMKRNSYHNYPQPIPKLIQLKGQIQRQINKRGRREEQA